MNFGVAVSVVLMAVYNITTAQECTNFGNPFNDKILSSETSYEVISSPNYPNDYPEDITICFLIISPIGCTTIVTLQQFYNNYIYETDGCRTDRLEIERSSTSDREVQCGHNLHDIIIDPLTADRVTMRFVSRSLDGSSGTGFSCGIISTKLFDPGMLPQPLPPKEHYYTCTDESGHINTESVHNGQVIISPNYPENYGNSLVCRLEITLENNKWSKLEVLDFDLEESHYDSAQDTSYCYDYLEISDSDEVAEPFNRYYCGKDLPNQSIAVPRLSIKFVTDETITAKGYKLKLTEFEVTCGNQLISSNEEDLTGIIQSPGFDSQQEYDNNLVCVWTADLSYSTTLEFQYFELEGEDNQSTLNDPYSCSHDYLEVTTIDSPTRVRYCGKHNPFTVETFRGTRIVFVTDHADTFRGFRIKYVLEI